MSTPDDVQDVRDQLEDLRTLPNMAMLMIRTGKLNEALTTLEDLDKQMFDLAHPEGAE